MNNQNYAKEATIAQIEKQKQFFEIPPYQRLYEWKKDEIETLLDDMKKACDESKEQYFIGNITTRIKSNKREQNKSNNERNKMYILIDGQQRLTTLWFIGFYLASKDCGEWQQKWKEFILQNDKLRIAMPIRDKEREALENIAKKIQRNEIKPNKEGKLQLSKDLQGIHQKIIDAFDCIESWFANGNGNDIDLANFAKYIYGSVCFVFVELAQNTDLNRFFVRMNNRGKQLEKHEILKARILYKIKDNKSNEWQKYAKIWDLCSDMNKYIFQSASDRSIFDNSKDKKDNNRDETKTTEQKNDKLVCFTDIAEKYTIIKDNKKVKDNGAYSGVESIVDFPTFLLHCYKLWVAKKCNENEIPKEITITKDKLLEIMWDAKGDKNKHNYLFVKRDKQDCKDFIIDMLRYRVLFDYFVIKNTLSDDGFAIMRFYKNNNTYQPKANSLKELAMIQNYLRVARQGERQNYEHWLTDFLRFLDSNDLQEFNDIKEIKDFASISNNRLELPQFLIKKKGQEEQNSTNKLQEELIKKLEAIDTEQVFKVNLKDKKIDKISTYLSKGTNTPHYWFYRLEYYLWKWGKLDKKDFEAQFKKKFGDKFDDLKTIFNATLGTYKFKSIAKNFYFRNLNSVEHFHPQHLKKQNGWDIYIDYFGNLTLISSSTNSQYSDQLPKEKKEDLKNKLNKKGGNTESLKFFLMCAQCEYDKDEWEYKKNVENKHEKYMLEILKKSLGLNPNDSQDSNNSQGK